MMSKDYVRRISQKTKDLVYGYIRKFENTLDSSTLTICNDIMLICLLYYDVTIEAFSTKDIATCIKINDTKNIATVKPWPSKNDRRIGYHHTVYLTKVILQNDKGRRVWKFKCLQLKDPKHKFASIGINKCFLESNGNLDVNYPNYTHHDRKFVYGLKFGKNDIIEMTLDLNQFIIGFRINGNPNRSINQSFQNYDTSRAYISMQSVGDSFEFISYQPIE